MSKITRISTTLTARYSPASGATDAFWLDGRITGPRESRAADITLDREDKGFFFATFATQSSGDSKRDLDAVRPILEKTTLEIKHSGKNIDNQITDLAECSVGVSGRMSIQHEGVRQPFFAGIMVKDSEIAAVTMGRGCAYLYRNDTLYPLTKDETPFEAIDYNGKAIPNIDIYCAGVAGTVRYSNIAQLQVDDCIIVCNREIMEAVGQREILRILYEAQDQCDAAGLVITAAASKLPGTPIQFMIGFVESITVGERSAKAAMFPLLSKSNSVSNKNEQASSKLVIPQEEDFEPTEETDEDGEEDYDEDVEDYDSGKTKKFALIAIIAIVLIACGIAIYTLTQGFRKGNPSESSSLSVTQSVTGEESGETASTANSGAISSKSGSTSVSATSSKPASTSTSAASVALPATYKIQPGDLLVNIAKKFYNSTDTKYLDAIIEANKAKYPAFTRANYQEGWTITIPKV